jgi:uncharacterized spore protein YtfJ
MDDKIEVTLEPIDEMLRKLNANAVFGEPFKEGDVTLIPVANVGYGFGYGSGRGKMTGSMHGAAANAGEPGEGSGQGGGGGGMARPIGYIRISPDGVAYEPIMDKSRISMLAIGMIMWNMFWVTATIRATAKK